MKVTKIILLVTILTFSLSLSAQKCKEPFPEGKHLINTDEEGNNIAMEGYDLISFFEANPVKGTSDNATTYQGITYLFTSEKNKITFEAAPTKYMPQYGGFCAVAMYFGKTEELQTYDIYQVVDGKLYFNRNKKAKAVWDKKTPKTIIKKADKKWNCAVSDLGLPVNQPYSEPESIK